MDNRYEKVKTLTLKTEADTRMRDTNAELTTREVAREKMQSQLKSELHELRQEMLKKMGRPSLGKRQNARLAHRANPSVALPNN